MPWRSIITSIRSPACTCNAPIGLRELLDRNQAFGFVAEIDDDVRFVEFYDAALQQLAFVGRSKMRVVVDELLVIRLFGYGRV